MRFPKIGSRIGSRIDLELTQNDPLDDPPDWSRDGLRMTLPTSDIGLSHMAVSNKALFNVLLTIGELKPLSSKDWIRPPT